MKKLNKGVFAVALATAVLAAPAQAESQRQNYHWTLSPFGGGTGCMNNIPWFVQIFAELACGRNVF